jgi:hypothetical protein
MVAATPAGTLFTREGLLHAIDEQPDRSVPEEISTVQAARFLGRSPKWWRVACVAGDIDGAYTDAVGRWRFPTAAARAYRARLANQTTARRDRIFRGPNRRGRMARAE